MALQWLLVLLALAWPVRATWDSCRGTCGLRPLASDHSSDTSHAVDGSGTQAGAWPGIVSIQVTWENGTWHMCTGILLSPQWVLTVAHCFARSKDFSTWDVVMGATDLTQPGPEAAVRHVKRLLVHQDYVPAKARNDIALLELDQPVECSDYIQLGCVPDASLRVSELKSCYIAGWNFGKGLELQEAKVHLMDTELCNSSRWYAGAIHTCNLCAGYPHGGIDTCQGDSGSPLVCKDNGADYFWLVGLYSWGRGCERARHPGIYTSTQHYHNWIVLQTGLSPAERASPAPQPPKCATPKPEETTESTTRVPEPTTVAVPRPTTVPIPEPTHVPGPEKEAEQETEWVPLPEPELVPEPASEPELPAEQQEEEEEEEDETAPVPEPEPEPEPEQDRVLHISVPYRTVVKFCNLLKDFLQFLRDQLD